MSKVFVVLESDYDSTQVRGVFTDESAAQKFRDDIETPLLAKQIASACVRSDGLTDYKYIRPSLYVQESTLQ